LNQKIKIISVKDLADPPFNLLLSYPKVDRNRITSLVDKLAQAGVSYIHLDGETQISGLRLLGKGCTSIVFEAIFKNKPSAVKVLRTDADRATLRNEAEFLEKVNILSIGPRLHYVSDEFIIMELVRGPLIFNFITAIKGKGTARRTRLLISDILSQCFVLDQKNIAHCELSNPTKHIIIKDYKKPVIIDFESASLNKKYSNVTSLAQSLFIGGKYAPRIRRMIGIKNTQEVIRDLREYKQKTNQISFNKILNTLKLTPKQ